MPSPLSPTPRFLPLVVDLACWDLVVEALARQRVPALLELIERGALRPVDPRTEFVLEEDFGTLLRVRVVSGDDAGRVGWLPVGLTSQISAALLACAA